MSNIRRATSAVGRHCVQFVEKVCSIRNVTFAVRGKKVWSIKNVTSAVREEKCAAPGGCHLQYEEKVVQCEKKCTV